VKNQFFFNNPLYLLYTVPGNLPSICIKHVRKNQVLL